MQYYKYSVKCIVAMSQKLTPAWGLVAYLLMHFASLQIQVT